MLPRLSSSPILLGETPLKRVHTRRDRFDQIIFDALYSRSLVYNSCWEDPAVDRTALNLRPGDTLLVITSAGCNVLDYALTSPCLVHAVDANPRQTALLELKLTGIRLLEFDDFFAVFGSGSHKRFRALYTRALGDEISLFARAYWDKRTDWFARPAGQRPFLRPLGRGGAAVSCLHEGPSPLRRKRRRAAGGPVPGGPAPAL